MVLVVVALLVWGLSALARGGGTDGSEEEQNVAASGETTATVAEEATEAEATDATGAAESSGASESEESSATASESSSASESEEASASEAPGREPADRAAGCTLTDLDIRASSDQVTYGPDAQPSFYMTVVNPTRSDCEIYLDENSLRFEVYDLATNNRVWSDTDCFESVQTGTSTFEAGEERFFESVWSRTASAPGQCEERPAVPSGSYLLHTVIGDNPSEPHTFNLR